MPPFFVCVLLSASLDRGAEHLRCIYMNDDGASPENVDKYDATENLILSFWRVFRIVPGGI